MATSPDSADAPFDPERVAEEWLATQIAAGRLTPEPTADEIGEVARIIGPALRRIAARHKKPAA